MPSVAEVWLADDLARLEENPSPHIQADLYRCGWETGWTPAPLERTPRPYVIHHAVNWASPRGGLTVRMRVSVFAPVLGFIRWPAAEEWGREYVDIPPLTSWWQGAGWLVPDASWLNSPFTASDLTALDRQAARELRHWRDLPRGDALFFEW
ncbi:hypothetical protein V3W47_14285 [Deinococcus sp. YIM 134068]|uniref:hypothetical protein n=1 Tax=Deinococcus lichenicola TaxID=3118910 RepID=UPI002F95CE2C